MYIIIIIFILIVINFKFYLINNFFFNRIDLTPEEGGGTVELMPGGKDLEVMSNNVYDYVRKYAKYRMLKVQEKAIEVSYF